MNRLIAVLGMAGTLALAYGFDPLLEALRGEAASTFDPRLYLWLLPVLDLLLAAFLLLLAWFVNLKSEKSALVSVIFLVTGLMLLFSVTPVAMELLSYSPELFRSFVPPSPFMSLFHTAAFITVIGIFGFIPRPRT